MDPYKPIMFHCPLEVAIDDRERNRPLIAALEGMPSLIVSRERLDVGDYRWQDRLLVERKTLADLQTSIFEQRFFRQIHRLRHAAETPCLLIEGTTTSRQRERLNGAAIQGALIHASLVQGVPILRARDPRDSAWLMARATAQLAGSGRICRPALRVSAKQDAKRRLQHYVLEGIPGLGPDRTRELLARFGSIERLTQAGEDELREVPGIGPTTARRIRWIVSDRSRAYQAGAQSPSLLVHQPIDPAPTAAARDITHRRIRRTRPPAGGSASDPRCS